MHTMAATIYDDIEIDGALYRLVAVDVGPEFFCEVYRLHCAYVPPDASLVGHGNVLQAVEFLGSDYDLNLAEPEQWVREFLDCLQNE